MKSVFVIDDNGQGMDELRTYLRERGYSVTESGPGCRDALRFNQFAIDRACVQIFWLTRYQRIIYVNDSACQALGYTREELTRMSVSDIDPYFPGPESAGFSEYWRSLKLNGKSRFETCHRARNGRIYPVEIQSNFLEFEGVEFSCCFVTDIGDRKQTEEKLRESEEKFRLLTEYSPNAIALIQGERIVYVNPAVTEIYGFSREELIGKEFWKFVHEDFRDIARKRGLERQHDTLLSSRYEYKVISGCGEDRWAMVSSVSMEYEGKPALIVTLVDITESKRAEEERKNLEAQLHQAQKMEAIGQLAGGIAHDFNNILTAIMGFAEVIAMRLGYANSLRHHINQILTAVNRAASLTNGLLAFSRKQNLHKKTIEVHEIVYGVKKMLRRLIPEDIDFRITSSTSDMTVMADGGQIEQVLMNLVTNARDAMPSGGILMIDAEPVLINEDTCRAQGIETPGAFAKISVQDTGCGMDEEMLGKIFEPFFTTKKAGKGTGLGLSISYGIVKQHNGFITTDSLLGHGTTFHVYLPLVNREMKEHSEEQRYEPAPRGTETILLAEDDDTIRELIRMLLEESGYSVIDAVDGRDALEKFSDSRGCVDALVTDVIMPNMDGKALYEEIITIRPDMKVLFMSGYPADILDSRGVSNDCVNFLEKPVMPSVFLGRLREILDSGE